MKHTRILALLLAVLVMICLFSGCSITLNPLAALTRGNRDKDTDTNYDYDEEEYDFDSGDEDIFDFDSDFDFDLDDEDDYDTEDDFDYDFNEDDFDFSYAYDDSDYTSPVGNYVAVVCYNSEGEDVGTDGETLEIYDDGTGCFTLFDVDYALEWILNGDEFVFYDESGDTFTGYWEEYMLCGEYFDGYYYMFVLEDYAWLFDYEDDYDYDYDYEYDYECDYDEDSGAVCCYDDESILGSYTAVACTYDGEDMGVDDEVMVLYADGTGYFTLYDWDYAIEWLQDGDSFTFTDEDDDVFDGVWDGADTITGVYYNDLTYTLVKD